LNATGLMDNYLSLCIESIQNISANIFDFWRDANGSISVEEKEEQESISKKLYVKFGIVVCKDFGQFTIFQPTTNIQDIKKFLCHQKLSSKFSNE